MKRTYELLSQRIRERMEDKDVSVRELSASIQTSYENTRRMVQGRRRISEPVAHLLCKHLEIQPEEFAHLQTLDESRDQAALPRPSLTPMERFWVYLSEEHRQDLVCLARRWAGQDRVAKRVRESSDESKSSFAAGG